MQQARVPRVSGSSEDPGAVGASAGTEGNDFEGELDKNKINLEFKCDHCWQLIEHDEPRSLLYAPEISPHLVPDRTGDRVIMPAEAYTGERITLGRYCRSGQTFQEFEPWALDGKEKAVHERLGPELLDVIDQFSPDGRHWTGRTLLQLSDSGEAMAAEWNQSGLAGLQCSVSGCQVRAFSTCPQKCSTRLLCPLHADPAAIHAAGDKLYWSKIVQKIIPLL